MNIFVSRESGIQGADLAPMDIGKALDPQEEQEEEKKPVILEAEDEQCLKEYEEMLRQFPLEKEGERRLCFYRQ